MEKDTFFRNARKDIARSLPQNEEGLKLYFEKIRELFKSIEGDHVMKWVAPELVSCDYSKKEVELRFSLEKRFTNPSGTNLHGGMCATFLDSSLGMTISYFARDNIDTISLNIDYLKPVLVEKELFTRVRIEKMGKTIAFARVEAFQKPDTDIILARANSTFFIHRQ